MMKYRADGSAAYDVFRTQDNAARPIERPNRLPDAPLKNVPEMRVRTKLHVSPTLVLSGIFALVMLFLVVFSYMRLYEAQSTVSNLKTEREELLEEQEQLRTRYEKALNLEEIETRARKMGMHEPLTSQITYIEVDAGDTTEIYSEAEERNIFEQVFYAFKDTLSDVVEYFS